MPTPISPLEAPPQGTTDLNSEPWRRWFYQLWQTVGAGIDNSGPQGTFTQLQVGKYTFSRTHEVDNDLLYLNSGLYTRHTSSMSGIIYGLASVAVRTQGNAQAGFVVGAQIAAVAEKGVNGTTLFGFAVESDNHSGANNAIVGGEIAPANEYNDNQNAKWALNLVWKDRGDGAAATVEGLGANRYNYFSKAIALTSQARSSATEFCGFNVGIDFLSGCIDEETVVPWSAIVTFSPGQCVSSGGLVYKATNTSLNVAPPNVNFWVQRTVAGTANPGVGIDFSSMSLTTMANMASAIRLRATMKFHWEETGAVSTFFDAANGRWVGCDNQGTRRLQVDVGTGTIWTRATIALGGGAFAVLGQIGGGGPAVAGQNSWYPMIDNAGNAFFIPVWR